MAILNGNAFDNFFFSTNDPFDTINGFAGIDTVSYALATSGVSVNLSLVGGASYRWLRQ